jgi:hypothetical protein
MTPGATARPADEIDAAHLIAAGAGSSTIDTRVDATAPSRRDRPCSL